MMMHQCINVLSRPIHPTAKNCIKIFKEKWDRNLDGARKRIHVGVITRNGDSLLFSNNGGGQNDTVNMTTYLDMISDWPRLAE
jgi:hypothetical protein